ncbi:MAG: glycerol-3-phosphate dehydrogenase [Chaenotheca gracillima]|nr:MAG: glycerol-3-phosphate dehydrogenase [Chaenotheca gracillima]
MSARNTSALEVPANGSAGEPNRSGDGAVNRTERTARKASEVRSHGASGHQTKTDGFQFDNMQDVDDDSESLWRWWNEMLTDLSDHGSASERRQQQRSYALQRWLGQDFSEEPWSTEHVPTENTRQGNNYRHQK